MPSSRPSWCSRRRTRSSRKAPTRCPRRSWAGVVTGAGPRGGISLMRAARAAALLEDRDFVTPDDVKRMALPALRHRIAPSPELELEGRDTDAILKGLLEKIEAPRK